MPTTKAQIMEAATNTTIPVPITVSGAVMAGITVKDWVLIGTAILVFLQLIIVAPKAWRTVRNLFRKAEDKEPVDVREQ